MSRDIYERDQDFAGFHATNAADAVADADLPTFGQVRRVLPWERISANRFRLPVTQAGEDVGVRIQGNPVGSNPLAGDFTTRGLELAHDQIDGRAASNAQNGPVVIGVAIGVDTGGGNWALAVDSGDVVVPGNIGLWSRAIPMMIQPANPVFFNSHGSTSNITRHSMIVIPNSGLFTDGGGADITIGRVATLAIEGAPDTSDAHMHFGDRVSVLILNDPIHLGDGIRWGQNANGQGYEDVAGGGETAVAPSGHARRKYNPTAQSFDVSYEGDNWRPAITPLQFPFVFDPTARTYPVGDTVVHTIGLGDVPFHGFRAFVPATWEVPAAINITGGQLVSKINFVFDNGSQSALSVNTRTDAALRGGRFRTFLGVGSWVTSVQLIVTNTSVSTSSSQDVGQFTFEAVLL